MHEQQMDGYLHQRPPNPSDGSVTSTQGSGGDPTPAGAAGASAQTSRSDNGGERSFGHPSSTGEGGGGESDSSSGCRPKPISPHDSLGVFQTRSIFHLPRRASSGYFSSDGDSLPSSPLSPKPVTADKATQTPNPTAQVMHHALQRAAEEHGGGLGTHQHHEHSPSPSSTRAPNAAGVMQMEIIGRDLRRIGDDYNRLLITRQAERREQLVIPLNLLPHIHQEPTMLLCVGLLLVVIGRLIYLQGSTNSPDHSQV